MPQDYILSQANPVHIITSYFLKNKFYIILSILCIPSHLFLLDLIIRILYTFLTSTCMLHVLLIISSWFYHLNHILWAITFIKFLNMKFCPFLFLNLSTLFSSYTLNKSSSHRVRYQISHPYKTTGKIKPCSYAISFSYNFTYYNSQWLCNFIWNFHFLPMYDLHLPLC
jgi:hypothetical protein